MPRRRDTVRVVYLVVVVSTEAVLTPADAATASEAEALLAWKVSLQDGVAALSGWTRAAPVCGWPGVGCDAADCIVMLRLWA
ncbi:hypothetical protein GUJ93_ZPchr0012g20348 [Zizania palustris]|uniref:Leucine-rich repeat-containing N-terminal plant-type domain-containing protein n=1 Tax=Zizania palustris TaxID=103762 RepID=A0A8J5WHT4_ZIZPA|nr:hypothetical protein GUJ93_ZPchr0012g20348 [Zizania palustris]